LYRYFFEISYNGQNFHGWQIQPNANSIQEEIEKVLTKLNGNNPIEIVGCGRTDSGVHAQHYIFHADYDTQLTIDLNQFRYKLNKVLSDDVVIHSISLVSNDLHARFSAVRRTYRYFFHAFKNPFIYNTSWCFQHSLDFKRMNEACQFLIGTQDFSSFSKSNTDVKTNICTVFSANWVDNQDGTFYFEISADRFLRNMVRAIVGTLIEVGKKNVNPEEIKTIITKKNRGAAAVSVPAHGLYLWKVEY